jgi:pilus assembly protein CpaE
MTTELRVLITDEDPDSRVTARKALQRAGLGVAGETGYGTSAVSFALESRPDAILIAVEEPAGRPLETAESLATALPDTPIIIYSSDDASASIRRGMVFGARDYLVKPLTSAAVAEAVTRSLEQEERRQLRRAGQLPGVGARGSVITVTGAKGGVGKSVLTVNLAIALRRETGKSVAVLDADTQFGDVATMLDLAPTVTVADLLRQSSIDRTNIRQFVTAHPSGIDIIAGPGADDAWENCPPERLQQIIAVLAQNYEFLVVDTSGSFDRFVRNCVETSTHTLIVTTGEVSSLRDTAAALRRLEGWDVGADRVAVVLVRNSRGPSASEQEMAVAVGRPFFATIPFDKAVPQSVQVGQPVILTRPKSPMAAGATLIAHRLAGTRRSLTAPQKQPMWKRVLPMGRKEEARDADVAAAKEVSGAQQ